MEEQTSVHITEGSATQAVLAGIKVNIFRFDLCRTFQNGLQFHSTHSHTPQQHPPSSSSNTTTTTTRVHSDTHKKVFEENKKIQVTD